MAEEIVGPDVEELEPVQSQSAPTEVDLEAGGLRVRVSSASEPLSVVADTARSLWDYGNRSTPRREVGFEAPHSETIERRAVTDQGWSHSPDGHRWDSGRDA